MNTSQLAPSRTALFSRSQLLAGVALAGTLLFVYWPTLYHLALIWYHDPKYSHGFLVPLFAGYLLWLRRGPVTGGGSSSLHALPSALHPNWWGVPTVAAGLVMQGAGNYYIIPWLAELAVVPLVAGLCLSVGGWRALAWAWPAIVFLVFMVPLPYWLEYALGMPLRRLGTRASVYLLQTAGYPARAEGNVIIVNTESIGVAEACSGLSMLVMFITVCTAVAFLVRRRSPYDKVLVLLSAVPLALVCNVLRIVATAVLYVKVGHRLGDLLPVGGGLGETDLHDVGGWLLLPLALAMLWVELAVLAWLLIPRPAQPRRAMGGLRQVLLGGASPPPAAATQSPVTAPVPPRAGT